MAELSSEAYMKALQSRPITLIIGENQEHMTIAKNLLCHSSQYLAGLVANEENTIFLPKECARAVMTFVQWCYQRQLPKLPPGLTLAEKQKLKIEYIDVWMFGGRYYITKLQNEAMTLLIALFNAMDLLTIGDLKYVWPRTKGLSLELRTLLIFALVAQIEEGQEGTMGTEHLDDIANLGLRGMMRGVYESLRSWKEFQMPKITKKDKRTKWFFFMKNEDILEALMVDEAVAQYGKKKEDVSIAQQQKDAEMEDVGQRGDGGKQEQHGVKRQHDFAIKRENKENDGSPWKFSRSESGGPEVIELD